MWKRLIGLVSLVLFFVAAVYVTVITFRSGHPWIGSLIIFVTLLTSYTFWSSEALHLRFLYPGLLVFFIFTVIPILYSIYVSTTNLSTGHLLSKGNVIELFRATKVVDDENSYDYILVPNDKNFRIYARSKDLILWGAITSGQRRINLRDEIRSSTSSRKLTLQNWNGLVANPKTLKKGDVFKKVKELGLKEIDFIIGHEVFRYATTSTLAKISDQYTIIGEDEIRDNSTGLVYKANDEVGYFENNGHNLMPGYSVSIGFKNFITLFTSAALKSSFFKVLRWTLIWAICSVVLSFTVGLFLALLLNDKRLAGKAVYRIVLIIPYAIPFFISVLVFRGLLNQDFGVINHLIGKMGLSSVPWLYHATWAKVSCLMVNLWLSFPYMFLLITGILQSIPESIYEAAKLEGAGQIFTLRKITFPMIFSAVGPLLIGSFAFNLNNFVSIYLLTGGGPPVPESITPAGETDILISYTYRMAFEGGSFGQNYGLANSISILIFVIIAIITLINFKLTGMTKERNI
jgi:ABC-type sugar transport system permease subunit